MTALPARRFKLESELNDSDRINAKRLGSTGQIERDDYVKARRVVLQAPDDHDPALLVQLLREEADSLADAADRREQDARDRLSVDDWIAHDAARGRGEEPPATFDARTGRLLDKATGLRDQADELEAHMAERETASAAEAHYQQLRAGADR